MDLTYSGRLLDRGFTVVLLAEGWGLAVPTDAAPIVEGLTKRFGEFLEASESEQELAFRNIENEVKLILS